MELIPEWDQISMPAYTVATSDGTVSGEDLSFNGIGEVLFTGEGSVRTTSISTVTDFTGNYTQEIKHNHTLVGEGMFDGRGTLSGSIISGSSDEVSISDCGDNDSMPENESYCYLESGDILIDGIVNASGRFTSNGSTEFTQMLSHSSLVGSGFFEVDTSEGLQSYGTINGTGIFSGTGDFSGPNGTGWNFPPQGHDPRRLRHHCHSSRWVKSRCGAKYSLSAPHKVPRLRKSISPGM